ncbi:MAG: PAS domain S-box protein [Polyangiales bacterium]
MTCLLITTDNTLAKVVGQAVAPNDLHVVSPDDVGNDHFNLVGQAFQIALIDTAEYDISDFRRAVRTVNTPTLAVIDTDDDISTRLTRYDDFMLRTATAEELRMRIRYVTKRQILRAGIDDETRSNAYANFFASAAEGIVVFTKEAKILFANPSAFEILGQNPETVSLENIWDHVAPDERDSLSGLREGFDRGEFPLAIDIHAVRGDGGRIIINCSFAPLIGSEKEVVLTFKNVTDARRIEEELVKTMEFLESLIDASVDGIVATDMSGMIILFNPSAERIYGYHAEDVIGQLMLEDLLHPADCSALKDRLLNQESIGATQRVDPISMEAIGANGESIPIRMSASVIFERNAPSAIVLMFTDLRERVRAERRLAEAQKQLAFNERQAVLAELAGTAAHELNQPLTSMMAYAEMLLRKSGERSDVSKAATVMMQEAERMAEIVKKIGRITKYETKSYVGEQRIFDLDRASESPSNLDKGNEE